MNAGPVLRGMAVAAAPLRLRREPVSTVPVPPASSIDDELARAREQALSQGIREGHAEGWSAGYGEGMEAGRAEAAREAELRAADAVRVATASLQDQQARLSAVLAALGSAHGQVLSSAEDDLVALCFETLVRIVGRAAVTPEVVRAVVQRATATMQRQPRILLRLHADDAALLDACAPSPEATTPVVAWCADDEVAWGGCIVESPAGTLDLRLETLVAGCRTALLHAREQRRSSMTTEGAT